MNHSTELEELTETNWRNRIALRENFLRKLLFIAENILKNYKEKLEECVISLLEDGRYVETGKQAEKLPWNSKV